LNQLLYAYPKKSIPNSVKDLTREDILSTHFEFGNMGIGLIPDIDKYDSDLLKLYDNNEKLIYNIIFNNFIGLLQTLEIMNGKYYINWVNIVPLNLTNYKESHIYKETIEFLKNDNKLTLIINSQPLNTYYGLWIGDFYNVLRHKFYEQAITSNESLITLSVINISLQQVKTSF
jgi:hypothetical protein